MNSNIISPSTLYLKEEKVRDTGRDRYPLPLVLWILGDRITSSQPRHFTIHTCTYTCISKRVQTTCVQI